MSPDQDLRQNPANDQAGIFTDPVEDVVGQFVSDQPKDISEYQFGDDIFEYIKRPHSYARSLTPELESLYDDLDSSVRNVNRAWIARLDCLIQDIPKRGEAVLVLGKLKADMIFARQSKATPLNPPSDYPGVSGTSVATVAPGEEVKQSRMAGVDVASLPAGFGKRRPGGGSIGGSKKPKTPTEPVPEILPNSTAASPVPSP